MKVFLTGMAGFIGYHTARALVAAGHEVLGIDSLNAYYDPALKHARLAELGIRLPPEGAGNIPVVSATLPGLSFRTLQLEDREALDTLVEGFRPDRVCHLAAQAGVRYSIDHPHEYGSANLEGFLNILECVRRHKAGHLVYASSSSVYGLGSRYPYREDDPVARPASLYAATKRANELMAHTYSHLYGIPATGLRFFTVYGPWGRPDMAYYKFARAMDRGETIDVYNNGDMYRDFTYIDDIVSGILAVLLGTPPSGTSDEAPCRIYNLGNHRPERLLDFINVLEGCLGKTAGKQFLPLQPGDVLRTEADIGAMQRDFGWEPVTDIRTGLARFADWYRSWHG